MSKGPIFSPKNSIFVVFSIYNAIHDEVAINLKYAFFEKEEAEKYLETAPEGEVWQSAEVGIAKPVDFPVVPTCELIDLGGPLKDDVEREKFLEELKEAKKLRESPFRSYEILGNWADLTYCEGYEHPNSVLGSLKKRILDHATTTKKDLIFEYSKGGLYYGALPAAFFYLTKKDIPIEELCTFLTERLGVDTEHWAENSYDQHKALSLRTRTFFRFLL